MKESDLKMLRFSLIFLVVAIVAAVLDFGGIASITTGIAKVLFFVFLIAFVISLVMGLSNRRTVV